MSTPALTYRDRDRGPPRGGSPRLGPRRVRRPALPDLLLAEAVVRARPHGLRARARDRRHRARHPPVLQRDLRDARAPHRALRAQADPARDHHRRRAAQAGGPEPLGAVPRPLLPHPQGRAAHPGAEPYDAWVSGIRRDQSPSRADARKVERSDRYGVWKVQPLADWGEEAVWRYIKANDIPFNPLHDAGYRSIGCIPCTRPTRPDEEERAGRWAGSDKLECGIHLERKEGHGGTHVPPRES